jgi:imidazolonepropionase
LSVLVTGIAELVTNDPAAGDGSPLGVLPDAALVIDDGRVAWLGPAGRAPAADERRDVGGRAIVPGFVDSHTHLVFAGDRAAEFEARMNGQPYDGGGIASTVAATRAASDDTLRSLLAGRITEAAAGVHRDAYVAAVAGPMLAACAPLARWIDVFCEPASAHAFDGDEARTILTAGQRAGLGLRVHGNQLSAGPGVRLAVELGAASVDHCTHLTMADVDALAGGSTVATLLPGVEFATRSPYPDARRLLDAGVTVALASDCNPGSCYTSSMPFVIALAVRELRMTPAEALWAATAGAARALRRDDIGVLSPGRRADLAVLDAPSHVHLAYRPGVPLARAFPG